MQAAYIGPAAINDIKSVVAKAYRYEEHHFSHVENAELPMDGYVRCPNRNGLLAEKSKKATTAVMITLALTVMKKPDCRCHTIRIHSSKKVMI